MPCTCLALQQLEILASAQGGRAVPPPVTPKVAARECRSLPGIDGLPLVAPPPSAKCALCSERGTGLHSVVPQDDPKGYEGSASVWLHYPCARALRQFWKSQGRPRVPVHRAIDGIAASLRSFLHPPLRLEVRMSPSVAELLNTCLPQGLRYVAVPQLSGPVLRPSVDSKLSTDCGSSQRMLALAMPSIGSLEKKLKVSNA